MNNKTETSIMGKTAKAVNKMFTTENLPWNSTRCFSLVILRIFISFRQFNNGFTFQEVIIFDVMTQQLS